MISYQWDSQSIMVKVKDKLRQAGYKVWMDVEHMSKFDYYFLHATGNQAIEWQSESAYYLDYITVTSDLSQISIFLYTDTCINLY